MDVKLNSSILARVRCLVVVRAMIVGLICFELALPPAVLAQTLSSGYKRYTQGDFRGAIKSLQLALKRGGSNAAKAKMLKYLGISYYMVGNKQAAAKSFQLALKLNQRTAISPSEVLDTSVIALFNAQRQSTSSLAVPRTQSKRSRSPSVRAQTKKTTLTIMSNAKDATVLIDGILAGNAGVPIETNPGIINVQLNANGYISKKARVRIIKNRDNRVTLNLSKPKPKPKPKRKVAKSKEEPTGGFLPDPGGDELFGDGEELAQDPSLSQRNLADEFNRDAVTGGYTAPPQAAPAPSPGYAQPYGLQQPGYSPYPPQQPYPQMPYAPVPAPAQPYGYYGASPYPQPYAAPPQYIPPQQVPPPAPPAVVPEPAPTQPHESPTDYYQEPSDDEAFLPLPDPKPTKKRKKRKKIRKKRRYKPVPYQRSKRRNRRSSSNEWSAMNYVIALLPFGAGQYQNESYILGALFTGAEIGALTWFWLNKQDADAAVATAEEVNNDDEYTDEEKEEFVNETNEYVANKRQQQDIGLYGFLGLWAIGAGEAIINKPNPKRRRRRRVEWSLNHSDAIASESSVDNPSEFDLHRQVTEPPKLSFGVVFTKENTKLMPGLGLKFDWKF